MEVWLRKCSSFQEEAEADQEYWGQMSPDERVAAIEDLRQDWLKMKGSRDEGLRRTVRVLKQERS